MTYGPRRMQVGEVFSAQESHARLLVSIGRARPVDQAPPRCEVAEEATLLNPKRRKYKRRDMRAED